MTDNPPCKCHGEPQYWTKSTRHKAGGFWRCAVKRRETSRSYYYERMSTLVYGRRGLYQRRYRALERRRERQQRREHGET